jgi:lysine-N-methylase
MNRDQDAYPHPASLSPPRRPYLRPQYVEQFRCIAAACEDTCCQGWSVPIDQATYEKYSAIESMKPHLGTIIVLNPQGAQRSDFARISTSSTSACFFFDDERLCSIQKQHGPSLLSSTCENYPRAIAKNSGVVERSLSLSCPEAARLTLLHGDLLGNQHDGCWQATGSARYAVLFQEAERFQKAERLANGDAATGNHIPSAPVPVEPVPYDPLLATREFALLLLTDRSYPVWQRLLLLGTVAGHLRTLSQGGSEGAFAAENPATIAQLLADSAGVVSQDRLRAVMDEIEIQPAEQLPLILDLLRLRLSQPPISPRLLACLQEFETGLECATATNEAQILANFTHAFRAYFKPLLERHPHLLENYLVNYVFRNNYPFGKPAAERPATPAPAAASANEDQTNAGDEHLLLCAQLALLQTVLIGMAAHHREAFNCDHVVKLVQSLAKSVEHSKPFLRQIATFVEQRKLNNLRGIALLLKPQD